jgi:hypothetical protein
MECEEGEITKERELFEQMAWYQRIHPMISLQEVEACLQDIQILYQGIE